MAISLISVPRKKRRFLTYDLEWIPGTMRLRMVGVYDGERYRSYKTVAEFLDAELTNENSGAWFYAHAGGMHDVAFVMKEVIKRGGRRVREKAIDPPWSPFYDESLKETVAFGEPDGKEVFAAGNASAYSVDASFSSSSAIIVKIQRGSYAKWCFVDSFWLLRVPLAKIGKWLGMEKGEGVKNAYGVPFEDWEEAEKREWYSTVSFKELESYNEQDCKILWNAIDQFEETIISVGGQLQMTLASTAMHLFRRRFLKREVTTDMRVNRLARGTYVGSRVEPFRKLSMKRLSYFDINSSFPFAMLSPCPGEKKTTTRRLPDDEESIFMVEADVTVPESHVPPVPYRLGDRVFFPTGSWRAWFTSIDFRLLEREGCKINRTYESVHFHPNTDLAEYANTVYDMRKAGKSEFEKIVYKLLLNSLYGKFAENDAKRSMHVFPFYEDYMMLRSKETQGEAEMLFPGVWLENNVVEVAHMHVPVSTHITAIARRNLFNYLKQAVGLSYCDTDSIISESTYPESKELGGMKLEHMWDGRPWGKPSGEFYSPKVYRGRCALDCPCEESKKKREKAGPDAEHVIVKAKGFSLGRKGREQLDRFEKLTQGEEIKVTRQARLMETYRKRDVEPRETEVKKRFRDRVIPKRKFLVDGSTRPWDVKEIQAMTKKSK